MASIESVRLKVGMEIHVELRARTKMFTRVGSPAHPDHAGAEPNTLIDPVVMALPGALPTPNREAVELAMLVGMALGCEIARTTRWDRKSYFYPDLPKSYQISQYDQPLCGAGQLDLPRLEGEDAGLPRVIRITRAHLEEDAGKLLHEWPGGIAIDHSIVDLNRAGTALLEIVTEPDFTSADDAVLFARTLRDICRFLGASDCILEQGQMRFEPNINTILVLEDGAEVATPIVEIKNLNSFRALKGAIEHEHREQPERYLRDGRVLEPGTKSTRGWDETRGVTQLQREKEEAHDYRYFPDPDLPELEIDQAWRETVRARLSELPHVRAARYRADYALGVKEARALVEERATCELFEAGAGHAEALGIERKQAGRACAHIVLQQLFMLANEAGAPAHELGVRAAQLGELAALRAADRIGSSALEPILSRMAQTGASAREVAQELGLEQIDDDVQLRAWCDEVIAQDSSARAVLDVKSGKNAALGRLIGDVMKRSGGKANAKRVREMLLESLGPPE